MIPPAPPHRNTKTKKEEKKEEEEMTIVMRVMLSSSEWLNRYFFLKELKERRVKRLKLRTDKDTALQLCELLTDAVCGGGKRKHAIFPVLLYLVYSVRQVEEA